MNKKIDKLIRLVRKLEIVATDLDIALSNSRELLEDHYEEDLLRQMAGERAELSEEDLLDKVKDKEILEEIERLEYENANCWRKKLENKDPNSSVEGSRKTQKENNAKIRLLEKIQDQKCLLKAKREDKKRRKKE